MLARGYRRTTSEVTQSPSSALSVKLRGASSSGATKHGAGPSAGVSATAAPPLWLHCTV